MYICAAVIPVLEFFSHIILGRFIHIICYYYYYFSYFGFPHFAPIRSSCLCTFYALLADSQSQTFNMELRGSKKQ